MGALRQLFGPTRGTVWRDLAGRIGGEFQSRGWLRPAGIRSVCGPWTIVLDQTAVRSRGGTPYLTRMRAAFLTADGFSFSVRRSGIADDLAAMFGRQDQQVGDPHFDSLFQVRSNNAGLARRLFEPESLRRQLHDLEWAEYELTARRGGWLNRRLPPGVLILQSVQPSVVDDAGELKRYYDAFVAILRRLAEIGSALERDPKIEL